MCIQTHTLHYYKTHAHTTVLLAAPFKTFPPDQGLTGSQYPTRPELFFKYPTRPDPKIENDWVPGN